jgi:rRNA-processing protein FCF1
MKKILIDTNFLIDLVKFKIPLEKIEDVIEEKYELYVPTPVIDELKRSSTKYVKAALKLVENLKVIENKGKSADMAIFNLVDKDTIVATNDKKLRAKLKKVGIKTIYLKGKKYLAIG